MRIPLPGNSTFERLLYAFGGGMFTRIQLDNLASEFDAAANIGNVLDYGAIGDGISDDGPAMRAAISANRIVYMPTGTYRYTGPYLVLPSNTCVFGDGSSKTIIKPDTLSNPDGTRAIFVNTLRSTLGLSTAVLTIPANQTDTTISIDGIGFDLSNCATPSTSVALGSFLLATNISVRDIRADNFAASSAKGWSGFQFVGCDNYMVDGFFGRHCVNALDNWKGSTRARFSNLSFETADAAGNGGAINWQAIGTTRADFNNSDDLQVSNATFWLNNGSIGLFLDTNGAGSASQNILLNNIHVSARTGTTGNQGIIFRGRVNRLKVRGASLTAVSGADLIPINVNAFFDGTAAVTSSGLITTQNGSPLVTVSYPGGANSGPGNFLNISNGSGGAVTGNGLSLLGYYPIVSVSGPVTSVSCGNSFVVNAGSNANADGVIAGTTHLVGFWGAPASCDLSSIMIDGCAAQGGDLITLAGTGHHISGVVVTTNYNGSTTPQYRSIVAIDTSLVKGTAVVASHVNGIVGAPGTVSLQGGWNGDNTLTWLGSTRPNFLYGGSLSVDHLTSTVDATIGTTSANNILIQGRATGFPPRILAQGSDTDVSLGLHFQGAGSVQVQDSGGVARHILSAGAAQLGLSSGGVPAFQTTAIASQVNYVTAQAAVTGSPARLTAANSGDTNAGIFLVAKGTSGVLAQGYTPAATPTTADIPLGCWAVWKDTSGGTVKIYYNDAGTLKSVALS